MQCLDYPLLHQRNTRNAMSRLSSATPRCLTRVFLGGGWGRHPTPIKRGKMHDKGHIWGKFYVNVVLHLFIFV